MRTSNISEVQHNRFQIIIGKHHPDSCSTLTEIQKGKRQQKLQQLKSDLQKRIQNLLKRSSYNCKTIIRNITQKYEEYKNDRTETNFIRVITHNEILNHHCYPIKHYETNPGHQFLDYLQRVNFIIQHKTCLESTISISIQISLALLKALNNHL